MNCSACGRRASPDDRFCSGCGASLSVASGHGVSTGGGDINGSVYQAGRDVVVNPASNDPPPATYEAVPIWRSPFTLGVLSWLGLVLGLAGLLPLWKMGQSVLSLFSEGLAVPVQRLEQHRWGLVLMLCLFVLCLFMLILVTTLRRLAKFQLRKPLFLGWALSGLGRRITLERIRAGECPKCGGKMRYYNKGTEWVDYFDSNGFKRRKVTGREPYLECERNPDHCFWVDPAEHREE